MLIAHIVVLSCLSFPNDVVSCHAWDGVSSVADGTRQVVGQQQQAVPG